MHKSLLAASVFAVALSFSPSADAQRGRRTETAETAENTEARDLFRQGLEAARGERWEEARDFFEASYASDPRPSTLVNLASAYAKTDRVVEAIRSYESFLAMTLPPELERLRPQVERALDETSARVAQVTVRLRGGRPGDRVFIDGEALPEGAVGTPFRVNPGDHHSRVDRGGDTVAHRVFVAREAEHLSLDLDASGTAVATQPPATNPETPPDGSAPATSSGGGSWRTPVGWTALGVGVVGLGTGVAMHILRENEVSGYASTCPNPVPAGDVEYCTALRDATNTNVQGFTIGAGVGYALGGAALVTGIVLLWVLPKPDAESTPETATIGCAPTFGNVVGASCAGTF